MNHLNTVRLSLVFSLLISSLTFAPSFADTTWVSGAVSGEWTRDGNPYIVVDSTWVPRVNRLDVLEAVEVYFTENQGLYVFGTLSINGTEDDSVRIRVVEGVESWDGIHFANGLRVDFNYLSLICPDSVFFPGENCALTFNNSLVYTGGITISSIPVINNRLTFNNTFMRSYSDLVLLGGSVEASRSVFYFEPRNRELDNGFWTEGASMWFRNCEVTGSFRRIGGTQVVDSCRFYHIPESHKIYVVAGGWNARVTNTYVEGDLSISGPDGSVSAVDNCLVLGGLSAAGNVLITNTEVRGHLTTYVGNADTTTVRNCVISAAFAFEADFDSNLVIVDSCVIWPGENYLGGTVSAWGHNNYTSNLRITNSYLLLMRLQFLDNNVNTTFDHNLFTMDSVVSYHDYPIAANLRFTNNIFATYYPLVKLFRFNEILGPPFFQYNCLYGFDHYAEVHRNDGIIEAPDTTNIVADPLLNRDGFLPFLTANSPCIDRGDPEALPDADDTRSDIGPRYFNQRLEIIKHDEFANPATPIILEAYPNPFNSILNISVRSTRNIPIALSIYDTNGRLVVEFPELIQSNLINLDLNSLPTGGYWIKACDNTNTKLTRVNCIK